mmetsp:Transcript_12888/g.16716  ORF Transcript_12888/g.16716 Transcript_12888/m.16716 type:complete len:541 (+) Transcript_12888:254-1876(+)
MEYLEIAKEYYEQAKKAVTKTETEQKLANALSRQNWGASSTELREIARLTFDWQEYGVVMKAIWSTLQYTGSRWRQIFKALTLLEYLVKNGAEKCVDEAREHMYQIKSLTGFSYYDEGNEKGTGIRELSKKLIELLNDSDQIKEEREKAKANRDKFTGMGKDGMSRSGFPGGSYDSSYGQNRFGGSGGRYDDGSKYDSHSNSKPWDDGFAKKDSADSVGDDYDPFETMEKPKSKPKKSKAKAKDKGKGKSKGKGKIKIKINTQTIKKDEDDEDLFGNMESAATNDKASEQEAPFDPFNNAETADTDDWGGFSSANKAPSSPANGSEDLFGDFAAADSAPVQNQNDSFDAFGSFTKSQPVSTSKQSPAETDFFGAAPASSASPDPFSSLSTSGPSNNLMGGAVGMSQQPLQMGMGTMQPSTPAVPQTTSVPQNQQEDAFGGLVDLANLSLNNKPKQAMGGQAMQQSQAHSMGAMKPKTMMQPMQNMMQPMQPMQNMMQPMQNMMQPTGTNGGNMGFPSGNQSHSNGMSSTTSSAFENDLLM